MNINLSLSPAPGIISNWLVVAIYRESAPTSVVDFQAFAAPHDNTENVTFTGLDDDFYVVVTYENSTNTPGGTVRHRFNYDPTWLTAEIRVDLVLICGQPDAPVPNTSSYTRADLADWTYNIERRMVGKLVAGLDLNISNNGTQWDLLQVDANGNKDVFAPNEVWIVSFQPRIVNTNLPQNSKSIITATVVVNADLQLDASACGKLHLIQGDNDTVLITLPPIDSVPDNNPMMFVSEGGNHIMATIQTQPNQYINFLTLDQAAIFLGQGSEQVWIFSFGGKYRVINAIGNFTTVGEIISQYKKTAIPANGSIPQPFNTVFADGSELSRAQYPRLWQYVQSLDSSELVTDSVWSAIDTVSGKFINKAKYSLGDGVSTFRVPLLYDPGFLRGVDGNSRKAGSRQHDQLASHVHDTASGTLPDGTNGVDRTKTQRIGQYNGEITGYPDLSGPPVKDSLATAFDTNPNRSQALGNETFPANTGVYLLIRI